MAVVIETTLGDITVDLYLDQRPVTCLNFLKLCKMKYYNYNLFHSIRSGFIAQTGDPTGEGSGGQSVFGVLEGPSKRFFSGEKMPKIRHTNAGLLSMVGTGDMMVGSQFFFTLAPDLDSLDGVHCVIGEVSEGHDVLRKLNEVICDDGHRPYQDVRITHTVILEDPFNDPTGFRAPSRSPSPSAERLRGGRIAPDEEIDETQGKSAEEVQEIIEEKEAKARATILEIVGDLPDADIAPPENVLFVCKLNPVTSDEDLEIIFSRFGKIVSCEVIRDKKTGDSLQYAFIEFSNKKSCEDAYFKMDNVLIDDRRIHVDFSQSVSKMRYLGKGRGVKYMDENDTDYKNYQVSKSNSSRNKNKERDNKRNHDSDKNHIKERQEFDNNSKEKKHKSIRDSNNHRNRSRSRSQPSRNRSRDRKYKKDNNLNSKNNSTYPKSSECNTNDNYHHKHKENKSKHPASSERTTNDNHNHKQNSNTRNLKSQHSTAREKSRSPHRRYKDSSNSHKDRPDSEKHYKKEKRDESNKESRDSEKHNKNKKRDDSRKESREYKVDEKNKDKELKKRTPKRKREDSEPPKDIKKIKKYDRSEQEKKDTRTPTPVEKKHSEKHNKVKIKQRKEEKAIKKRRKHSTSSSETDSSDSSSTSDSSSSSEDRRKRRRTKKRHRRHTSSSSSSSTSSDSSSSSTSSSESSSSSSSSDSEPRKRKSSKKVSLKKIVNKKSKKKS